MDNHIRENIKKPGNIKLNGEYKPTESLKVCDILSDYCRAERSDPKDLVVLVNGYSKGQDWETKDGDEIYIFRKNEVPDPHIFREIIYSRYSDELKKKLLRSEVLIMGLGGLGSSAALPLARCGVGKFTLIDFDTVDITNINRQQYSIKDIGLKKTEALKKIIMDINPYANVKTIDEKLDGISIRKILTDKSQDDFIVCEGFDSPEMKELLFDIVSSEFPAVKLVTSSGMAGFGSSNSIATRRFGQNIYIAGDGISALSQENPLMAPRVSLCADHSANMILRLIAGETDV